MLLEGSSENLQFHGIPDTALYERHWDIDKSECNLKEKKILLFYWPVIVTMIHGVVILCYFTLLWCPRDDQWSFITQTYGTKRKEGRGLWHLSWPHKLAEITITLNVPSLST